MLLDMSLVFKLNSVEDLGNLHDALKQTVTLQAKIKLEKDIKSLMRKKAVLEVEVEALTMEKKGMQPPTDDEKDKAVTKILEDDEETEIHVETAEESADEPHPEPSADEEHSDRLISLITEPIEETTENAETDPEAPG